MTVQGTLGSLLQGVSQQPERIRVPGQVTEQVNMYSDVSTGLSSRAGTDRVSVLSNVDKAVQFSDIQIEGERFILGYRDAELRIWDTQGTEFNLVDAGIQISPSAATSAVAYVGADMEFAVYDDQVYVLNRETVVQAGNQQKDYPFRAAVIECLGGNFSRTYTISASVSQAGGGGAVGVVADYETPDGTTDGDAALTTPEAIMQNLFAQIDPVLEIAGVTSVNIVGSAIGIISAADATITVTVTDGEGGTLLRVITDRADDTTSLPSVAYPGQIVTVVGDESADDDYYLEYQLDNPISSVIFGRPGVWRETLRPGEPSGFDILTMPRLLRRTGANQFTLSGGDWKDRQVGDEDSSPLPSFVGLPIRDINGFESRLVFVAGPHVIMSRTNDGANFFRETALSQLSTDPIDMTSTTADGFNLDHIVPFDRDLVVLSNPGEAQFVVRGGDLTPNTASLVLTTAYEISGQAAPVNTGRTIMFPFKSGRFSGIKEFVTNTDVLTNGADTLTEVQNKYIVGEVSHMSVSQNFNMLLVQTDNSAVSNTVWTYKYLWSGNERLQTAWSKWEFDAPVRYTFFDNSLIYVMTTEGVDIVLSVLDLNRPEDDTLEYHVTLDQKSEQTVKANSTVRFDRKDLSIVVKQRNSDPEAVGLEVTPVSVTESTNSTFPGWDYDLSGILEPGDIVVAGTKVTRYVDPTMPMLKDRSGSTNSSAVINVVHFTVHLEDSGYVDYIFNSPYRETYTYSPNRYPLDDEPLDPGRDLLTSSAVEVPWCERADYSSLRISSDDIRPTTIIEVEWQGLITGSRRRV